ncbi:MAG: AraC family transcriptional regulator [Candidatus Omnitrophica bacterium]|nr:AraC family transcriptional regulator [Candidatus Omnitrophota bacterium]
MESFFSNHFEIALYLENRNIAKALTIYEKKINVLLDSKASITEIKAFLISLNTSLYSYFFLKKRIALDKLCHNNILKINSCYSIAELILIGRMIVQSFLHSTNDLIRAPQKDIIKRALLFIHSNIDKDLTLDEVAKNIFISKNYLCSIFQKEVGYKFSEYVNLSRINLAKDLLIHTNYSLEIISQKCGFKNLSYFSVVFKKFVNLSPLQFRKKFKK